MPEKFSRALRSICKHYVRDNASSGSASRERVPVYAVGPGAHILEERKKTRNAFKHAGFFLLWASSKR